MSTDADLHKIVLAIQELETKFVQTSLDDRLNADDSAKFKRLVIEAKAMLDDELGIFNDFSTNLRLATVQLTGGPAERAVKSARACVEGGLNRVRRKPSQAADRNLSASPSYVSPSRIAELRALTLKQWDVSRLVRLIEELNTAYAYRCHMTVAMLVRSITDHVPPVFGCKKFEEVANNYAGAKSFRGSMQNLQGSLRNIADAHLHLQIRRSETLPTEAQVDFRADIDVLLGEFVRLLQ